MGGSEVDLKRGIPSSGFPGRDVIYTRGACSHGDKTAGARGSVVAAMLGTISRENISQVVRVGKHLFEIRPKLI